MEINVINGLKHISSLPIKDANIFPEQELLDCLNKIPKYKEIIVHCWDVRYEVIRKKSLPVGSRLSNEAPCLKMLIFLTVVGADSSTVLLLLHMIRQCGTHH